MDNENSGAELHFNEIEKEDFELSLFLNRIEKNGQKNSFNETRQGILDRVLDRLERLAVILWSDKLDEIDAAFYLRLPDPYNKGAETIRYHALRSRKLSFHKIGKTGLTFTKADLDKALKLFKLESHRDR